MSDHEQSHPVEHVQPSIITRLGDHIRQFVSGPQEPEEPIRPQSAPFPRDALILRDPTNAQKGRAVEAAFASNVAYDELLGAEQELRAFKRTYRMPESSHAYSNKSFWQMLLPRSPGLFQIMGLRTLESRQRTAQSMFDTLTYKAARVMLGPEDPYAPTLFADIAAEKAERIEQKAFRRGLVKQAKQIDEYDIQQLENTSAEEYVRVLLDQGFSEYGIKIAWRRLSRTHKLGFQLFDTAMPADESEGRASLPEGLETFIDKNSGLSINTAYAAELLQSSDSSDSLEVKPGIGLTITSAMAAVVLHKHAQLKQGKQ